MKNSHRPKSQEIPRKRSGGGMLLGLFLGLVVGVLIAFGVVWYLNKTPLPFMDKTEGRGNGAKPAAAAPSAPAAPGATAPATAPAAAPAAPVALPGKPGDKVGEKPRFDFYGILEGKPAPTPGQAAPASPAPTVADKPREVYFLQVGAFQKAADADNLKAKLAMSGVEASVQEVSLAEKGTLHRVRVGPMNSPDDMNRVRKQLADGGIQATVIKQKD